MAVRQRGLVAAVGIGARPGLGTAPPQSPVQVAATVRRSIVTIRATSRTSSALGSGFVVSTDGYVLTNDHVVAGHGNGIIAVTLSDGRRAAARFVGAEPESDLAVIKIDTSELAPAVLGAASATSSSSRCRTTYPLPWRY